VSMTGPRLLSSVYVAAACVLLPTVVAAQYAPYPYGFAPGTMPYQAQPPYMEDPDDLYYSPRARLRPQQVRPSRGITSFPTDADPDYSTTGASDEDVDFSETTRTTVLDRTGQSQGTLTIDTGRRKLYLSLGDGRALEYGIGVGRQGFAWKGEARVGRKAYWPGWTPPREMLARRPDLPSHMEGGLENPLGARALYLFQGNKDTLFRIHGTNEPDTIGKAVSSGCIRMLNADVIDLYQRVPKNTRVTVI
jgi:lipoprotein-anchoring transpeptidase ErfK/SrfK